MCLNHPETIPPPWSVEELSSMKPVPGAKNIADCCSRISSIKLNKTVILAPKPAYSFFGPSKVEE